MLSGGTDVHLVLVDLRESDPALSGRQAEERLHEIEITVNRNAVPFDPRPPMEASGLRIGTPALATRGLQQEDFSEVGEIIAVALSPNTRLARASSPAACRRSWSAIRCTSGWRSPASARLSLTAPTAGRAGAARRRPMACDPRACDAVRVDGAS